MRSAAAVSEGSGVIGNASRQLTKEVRLPRMKFGDGYAGDLRFRYIEYGQHWMTNKPMERVN
jgi:hypothetical protein